MKRLFDFTFAILGLIILSFPLIILSLIIIIFSPGPVLYSQKRVGRQSRLFTLYKFRTMVHNADKMPGGSITVANDGRITVIGKSLRRWKLDELPTLVNVLKGDMSLVGPRPDVPGYADKLESFDRRILELRPGITGPATLKYANEEQLLASINDPEKYNDEVIFSDKVKMNLDYLDNWSFWMDIKIIFKTIFRKNY